MHLQRCSGLLSVSSEPTSSLSACLPHALSLVPAHIPFPPLPPFPQLVSAGRVFEVLRWAEEWKQQADPSLVRHLVFGILEVSAPPYSPEFAGSMLRWVRTQVKCVLP